MFKVVDSEEEKEYFPQDSSEEKKEEKKEERPIKHVLEVHNGEMGSSSKL